MSTWEEWWNSFFLFYIFLVKGFCYCLSKKSWSQVVYGLASSAKKKKWSVQNGLSPFAKWSNTHFHRSTKLRYLLHGAGYQPLSSSEWRSVSHFFKMVFTNVIHQFEGKFLTSSMTILISSHLHISRYHCLWESSSCVSLVNSESYLRNNLLGIFRHSLRLRIMHMQLPSLSVSLPLNILPSILS